MIFGDLKNRKVPIGPNPVELINNFFNKKIGSLKK